MPDKNGKPTQITRMMKYDLKYESGAGEFENFNRLAWDVQKDVRKALNETIRRIYLLEQDGKKYGNNEQKALYHELDISCPNIARKIINDAMQTAKKKIENSTVKRDLYNGTVSLPSYKGNQPIPINSQSIKICYGMNGYEANIGLFSKTQKASVGIKNDERVKFTISVDDGTQRAIIDRVIRGEYKLSQSQLLYAKKKDGTHRWVLGLAYTFTPQQTELDRSKILGVDMGCVFAIYAASMSQKGTFAISGNEVTAFEKKQAAMQGRKAKSVVEYAEELERDKKSYQHQAAYCGEGRIGHGTKTRVEYAYRKGDKLANFRDTINHRYSKALVEYAVKNGYGTIHLEDLTGIKDKSDRKLKDWTYFDLQSKITYKAAEYGIEVVKISPQYTSQRCSNCGELDKNNRRSQSEFVCTHCGKSMNADYNAARNISRPLSDQLTEEDINAENKKRTRKKTVK